LQDKNNIKELKSPNLFLKKGPAENSQPGFYPYYNKKNKKIIIPGMAHNHQIFFQTQ
jgi:hypothetical protein